MCRSQSGCTPFAASLISDYFSEQLRGAALGVYNWGIYTGYSMSFALGNLITQANINGQGWRWVFIIAGIPGIFLGFLIMLTVREPERTKGKNEPGKDSTHFKNNANFHMKILLCSSLLVQEIRMKFAPAADICATSCRPSVVRPSSSSAWLAPFGTRRGMFGPTTRRSTTRRWEKVGVKLRPGFHSYQ